MPKNLLQDVKIKKTVRPDFMSRRVELPPREVRKIEEDKPKPRYTLWLVAVVSSLFFLFALSYMFLKVQVTVEPKTVSAAVNQNMSASKDGGAEALAFDLMVISGEEDRSVQATEEKEVTERARGVVLIYNSFSSASQRLDIDTRLEGSNGKIYKIDKQVLVPGMTGETPGSVEVGIYAAEEGAEYNSGPLDFTIVGFKGGPKYAKFYARSKGEIVGGFVGKTYIISDEEKSAIMEQMKTALQAKLLKRATDQIPRGFVLFKDAHIFNMDENNIDSVGASTGNTLQIRMKATLYGFLFSEERLVRSIAENSISEHDGSPVRIPNIRDLSFSWMEQNGAIAGVAPKPADIKNISFNLKGSAKIVWELDEDKFAADLLGKSKQDFNRILSQYPNVSSADLVISPFWKMSFPDKPNDIKVIVNYPQ